MRFFDSAYATLRMTDYICDKSHCDRSGEI